MWGRLYSAVCNIFCFTDWFLDLRVYNVFERNTNVRDLDCVRVFVPHGPFTNIEDFVRLNVRDQLHEAKQHVYSRRWDELIVGTGQARSTSTSTLAVSAAEIKDNAGFIRLLEETKNIRQLHLTLYNENMEDDTYDTASSPPRYHKSSKLSTQIKAEKNSDSGSHSKQIKHEIKVRRAIASSS
jgi:hypothetical protein